MPKVATKPVVSVYDAMEDLREATIKSTSTPGVADAARRAIDQLNELYAEDRAAFTAEDVRFANVLRGMLGARLAAHGPKVVHVRKLKRKGDKLDHCWRCKTPVDERFTDNCPTCSAKEYTWRVCPVCCACGCQRAGTVLI